MKKGIITLLNSILIISLIPFSLFADASVGEFDNDSVVGVQVEEYEEELSGVQGTRYRFNIILDGFYVGDFNIHVEYDSYNVTSSDWDHYTINRTVYVCGYDTYFETWMRSNWLPPSSITWSASVNNSDQCIYVGRMESTQLLNLLTSLRSSYNTNSAVTNGFLNQIDLKIDQLLKQKQWNIPFESIPPISYSLNKNYPIYQFKQYNDYYFPLFTYSDQDLLYEFNSTPNSDSYKLYNVILLVDYQFSRAGLNSNLKLIDGEWLNTKRLYQFTVGGKTWIILKAQIGNFTTQTVPNSIKFIGTGGLPTINGTLLYFSPSINEEYLSTDFALQFGYTNRLLNNLDVIVQGTQQSNSSVSDLDSAASDMKDSFDDFSAFENQIDNGFNNQMQNIDFSNPLTNNFGILPAANFVITIFNGLINNNPLSVLIIIVCILLIGKKIIGK